MLSGHEGGATLPQSKSAASQKAASDQRVGRALREPITGEGWGYGVQDSDRQGASARREVFDRELLAVKEGVVRMGALVATAIDDAMTSLALRDPARARAVIAADRAINEAQAKLTNLTITTIATQAPVARDLLFLIALTHVTYELERIGDHAAGIARQTLKLGPQPAPGGTSLIKMGELTSNLLHGVLRSLVDLDDEDARSVASGDDEVDRLYHAYFERALERMRADPSWVESGAHLLFAAKHLERIGDRVTNIAEEVVFLSCGEVVDLNP